MVIKYVVDTFFILLNQSLILQKLTIIVTRLINQDILNIVMLLVVMMMDGVV